MAPMQKRAWWGLGVGLAFAIAYFIVFFTMGGVAKFDSDTSYRLIIDALAIGALIVNLVVVNVPMRRRDMADERDIKVIDWAPRVQWLAVIFTLVAWTIGLTERYHATGLVPSVYLYVVFLSVLLVSTIAQSAGILLGYWRMDRNA
jgi:hypothetical protein